MFTLENVKIHLGLVIGYGGEYPSLPGGDRRVSFYQWHKSSVLGLDAKAMGGDVQEHQIGDLSNEDSSLDDGADGYRLVGIDTSGRLPPE